MRKAHQSKIQRNLSPTTPAPAGHASRRRSSSSSVAIATSTAVPMG
uniref:Kip1 n=1 Tax=Arundo donax TaxID=35708 RepID=A0A0A9H246_ARUDO